MSENKKYYWLKLRSDFFDDETIKFIEEQENGIKYSNFYLKLCLKSLKTDGKLMRLIGETLIPYDVNSLSKLTLVDVDTVRCAMELFSKIGLIKILETGEIYLSQIDEMIGSETDKAQLMRRLRAEKKINGNIVTQMLPKRYPEIEIEKEIEIDKEQEQEKENSDIVEFYNNNIGLLTPYIYSILEDYIKELGTDIVLYALKKSAEANAKSLNYIKAILDNWINNGYKNLLDVKKDEEKRKGKRDIVETEEERKARIIKELEEKFKNDN